MCLLQGGMSAERKQKDSKVCGLFCFTSSLFLLPPPYPYFPSLQAFCGAFLPLESPCSGWFLIIVILYEINTCYAHCPKLVITVGQYKKQPSHLWLLPRVYETLG